MIFNLVRENGYENIEVLKSLLWVVFVDEFGE